VHASAVSIGDRAVAIVGPSGSGKSTIAAALVRRGATLIAEDLLPLTMCDGRVVAIPAYAGIRLWPEAVALLMQSRDALPGISPTWDKRILEVEASQCASTALPLSSSNVPPVKVPPFFRLPVKEPRFKLSVANGPGSITVPSKARSLAVDVIPEFKLPDRTPRLVNEIETESANTGTAERATSAAHSNRRNFIFTNSCVRLFSELKH
jgi:energy-coupling factor transporter ATP-binding protein EcfA2